MSRSLLSRRFPLQRWRRSRWLERCMVLLRSHRTIVGSVLGEWERVPSIGSNLSNRRIRPAHPKRRESLLLGPEGVEYDVISHNQPHIPAIPLLPNHDLAREPRRVLHRSRRCRRRVALDPVASMRYCPLSAEARKTKLTWSIDASLHRFVKVSLSS